MADPRQRRLPGGGGRAHPVGGRRLHHHRPVPAVRARLVLRHDQRRGRSAARRADAADRPDQLHAQRRQGDGRRLHRQGHALRLGRHRPDPAGVAERVPGHGARPRPDPERPAAAPALPRGHVQGAALPVRALPRDRRQRLLPGANSQWQVSPGRRRARTQNQAPIRMFMPDPADRRRDLVADVELRAEQQDQPGRLRHRRLRPDVTGLRDDHRRASRAARTCRARPRPTAS